MISKESINEVREKTDIVVLIENQGVALKRAGRSYVGLCPMHSERSGSFYVNPESQTYHCFGCGEHGDAIMFMQKTGGYTFQGAVEYLAEAVGVVVQNTDGPDPDFDKKKTYININSAASWFFRSNFKKLPDSHPAKQQLIERNLMLGDEWMESFGIGYAPEGYTNLCNFLTSKGFTEEQIIDAGLAFANDKTGKLTDRFRNRLLWEIRNVQGKVIGFGGRKLREEDNPKYLNTPQTMMYSKSEVLYGLDLAKKKIVDDKVCLVVEGYTDVMAVKAVGFDNVVASCGTAFGDEHAAIIRRMIDDYHSNQTGRFVFVFDGDKAGIKAALRAFDITPSIKERSYVVPMIDGDPCDIRLRDGDEKLRQMLKSNMVPLTEFVLSQKMTEFDLSSAEGRQGFLGEALQIIQSINETALYESYRRKIAYWAGVPLDQVGGARSGTTRRRTELSGLTGSNDESTGRAALEKKIVAAMLQFPNDSITAFPSDADIFDLFSVETYGLIMTDAAVITRYDKNNGIQKTILKPSDFGDEDTATELFHVPLNLENISARDFILRSLKLIQRMERVEHNNNVRRELAASVSDDSNLGLDALKAVMEKRKKR